MDLQLLKNITCHVIEPSKGNHPEWSEGDGGKNKSPQSWGICQIQYRTAVTIGGLGPLRDVAGFPAVYMALGNPNRAKEVADSIYGWCLAVKKRTTVIGLAACYNGPEMEYPPSPAKLDAFIEKMAIKKGWNEDQKAKWKGSYKALREYAERTLAEYNKTIQEHTGSLTFAK